MIKVIYLKMIEFFKTLSKFFEIDKSGMTYTIRDPEEKLM